MPKMNASALQAMLGSQYASALAASNNAKLSMDRERALSYYNGDMAKDLPAQSGRSTAVSMDVADTIEGILPSLMEVFCGTDEVVKFDPVGPEDEQAAEQETDYINHVFMNQNPGFMVLYSFIKDALLSKTGIVKVWWEKDEKEQTETYLDKTPDEFAMIAANPEVEVTAHTEHDGLHDVEVTTKKNYSCARVMGVPPEEFGIEASARSIRDCNYCYHKIVDRTEQDLIEQGFDKDQVKKLPSYRAWSNTEETARDTVQEQSGGESDNNTSARRVEITEHYVRMDYENNGKPKLYRVTTGGKDGQVLKLDGKPDIIEFDVMPFAAMTPVIVTHRFIGRSLADLVMDIQRIKTSLMRAMLDNAYLANQPRMEVAETMASENTLDDLLVSRPGGIIRVKQQGAVTPILTPNIAGNIYPLMEYMDATREWRTGVTKQGQGIDANALQNQSATAVNQAFTASQSRVRLIARIFAETGIRDLFWLLHKVTKQHADQKQIIRLRNTWVPVDPRSWKDRDDLTIQVGLGTGSRAEQAGRLSLIGNVQKEMLLGGFSNLVPTDRLYNMGAELTKVAGYKDPNKFFADPAEKDPQTGQPKNPAPQPKPDPKIMQIQMQAQLDEKADQRKAQIEQVQAQADMATQNTKMQGEMAQSEREFQLKKELAIIDAQLRERLALAEEARKQREHDQKMELARETHQHTLAQSQMSMVQTAQSHQTKLEQMKNKPQAGA